MALDGTHAMKGMHDACPQDPLYGIRKGGGFSSLHTPRGRATAAGVFASELVIGADMA